jgi:hypothetical protein
LLVEPANRFFRDGPVGVVDEREATWPAGLAIGRQHYLGRFSHAGEMLTQVSFGGGVRQVPDKQTN